MMFLEFKLSEAELILCWIQLEITVQPLPKVKSLPHFFNMFQWVDCSNFSWIERLCTKILLSFCRTKKFSPQRLKEL